MIPQKTILTEDRPAKLLPLLSESWLPPVIRPVVFGSVGMACVDRLDRPTVCSLALSDFVMYAGDAESVAAKYLIETTARPCLVLPSTQEWMRLVEGSSAKRIVRYSFSNEGLDRSRLESIAQSLPPDLELRRFDEEAIRQAASHRWSVALVENFRSPEHFLETGVAFGAFDHGELVAGASSFARYDATVEIEVDTESSYRRRGLAAATAANLILHCLDHALAPHWDAANEASRRLAERLGFTLERDYEVLKL